MRMRGRIAMVAAAVLGATYGPAVPALDMTQEAAARASVFTRAQLEQLVAPIALYPDALLGQILEASTRPLEVVEANRWRQQPENAALAGEDLAAALGEQPWDDSVRGLVPFSQVLAMMRSDLTWLNNLGRAYAFQGTALMDAVQVLRQRARAAGTLKSTPAQVVGADDAANIYVTPAEPETVYVPYYDPRVAYGPWPWHDYPPFFFPSGWGLPTVGFVTVIVRPDWHRWRWDWRERRIHRVWRPDDHRRPGHSVPTRPPRPGHDGRPRPTTAPLVAAPVAPPATARPTPVATTPTPVVIAPTPVVIAPTPAPVVPVPDPAPVLVPRPRAPIPGQAPVQVVVPRERPAVPVAAGQRPHGVWVAPRPDPVVSRPEAGDRGGAPGNRSWAPPAASHSAPAPGGGRFMPREPFNR